MVYAVKTIKSYYTMLGAGLAITGTLLAATAHLILQSTPLTALGISTIILASIAYTIGRGQPKIPPEATALLMQAGIENIAALIEEIGLKSKAIYLPSTMTSGKPQALIPLHSNPHPPKLEKTVLPNRLIVKHGPNPEDVGLLVTTPGSEAAKTTPPKPHSAANAGDVEAALTTVLAGTINLADSTCVAMEGEKILVEVGNPRLEHRKMWVYESLGTPLASIVASVTAEVLNKPVLVNSEQHLRGKCVVELKIVAGQSF
jgi:hypothetical protein